MAYSATVENTGLHSLSERWMMQFLMLLLIASLSFSNANAAAQAVALERVAQTVNVPLYKSRIIQLDGPVHKISVGNKGVADILVMRANQVYIVGNGIGTTNILMWDKSNNLTQSLDVEVTPDLNSLKAKLHQLLPGESIRVNMSQGAIVLSGEVSNAVNMDTAMKVANSYLQKPDDEGATQEGSVINLMSIGGSQQVMLKVTVAEVSRSVMKRLGIKFHTFVTGDHTNFGAVSGGATFPDSLSFGEVGDTGEVVSARTGLFNSGSIAGPAVDEFAPGNLAIEDKGLFAGYLDDNFLFSLAIDAAKDNDLAKILAEPTLTALTGQEAEFLSGGEFPIPVPDDDGITIEFKEFGVGLKFIPVVLDSGRINLNLNVSVTELTSTSAITLGSGSSSSGFFVPALTKRSARSTVELGDGQTIGIAGLINENMRDVVSKFPGLGDIPVLGHLFRSQEFEKGETELVIMVTPTLAQPFNADEIALPGDGFVEPSDFEFYVLGRTHGVVSQDTAAEESEKTDEIQSDSAESDPESSVAQSFGIDETDTVIRSAAGGSESKFGHSIH
ncbi:type II and III secretion system protein family protein [Pontibacterium granulatum]|uniref:type II and III secretion system protein family protein n=1 Tax=Pontibacterium granulatum TaxID=2036029 RepID=UPI00249A0189|nr:type II and III secretion system protein family protein [Pontibacterium granulatum]MDI3323802.1 type II and III secretion system protein family protein [Pontibacterium granulatum]